jgi:DNA-binding transcriptional MocR family regulator
MQPPEELIPDEELRRCIVHVLRTEGPRALGYAPREGLVRLRTLVSRELSAIGVGASAEDIVITTGSQQAIDLVARALIDPGDTVLVEASTYSGAIHALTVAGARLVGVPSDEDGPDPDALRALTTSGAKCLYLMPNSRNPTGTTISAQRRAELVAWSHEAGVPLVEDDYGADLDLDPDPPMPPALRALDPEVLYTGTFSKKLIPALRVGFLVCPPGLRRPIVALKHTMDLGTSALLQHALAEFIERGLLRAHLRRIVPIYRERRDALDHALKAHMPPYVRWVKPRSGLVLWLELPSWLDAEVVYEEALDHGVLVTPGTMNAVGTRGQRGLRLVYCSEPTERLEEGARRLGAALRTVAMRQRPASAGGPAIDIV